MLDQDLIETPENVEIQRRLAGIGSRFAAGFVDTLLLILCWLVLGIILFIIWMLGSWGRPAGMLETLVAAALILIFFVTYWGYFALYEAWRNGQTPGKRWSGLRVVKEGGGAIGFEDSAIRNLLRVVDSLPFGYAVGGVCMFLTSKSQRLGDLVAGTVVVEERKREYGASTDKRKRVEVSESISPAALRATGLTPTEYNALISYWTRRDQFMPAARDRLLPILLKPILERTGDQPGVEGVAGLENYVQVLLDRARAAEEDERHAMVERENKL